MAYKNWPLRIRLAHWGHALLVVASIIYVWAHEWFEKGSDLRELCMQGHFTLGLFTGLFLLARVALRVSAVVPNPRPPGILRNLADFTHIAIYICLAALPVLGYVSVSGHGDVPLWGGATLPAMGAQFANDAREAHESLANFLVALILVHIAAAVFHHRVLTDGVLQAMLGTHSRDSE